jgi:hypothetical protein
MIIDKKTFRMNVTSAKVSALHSSVLMVEGEVLGT